MSKARIIVTLIIFNVLFAGYVSAQDEFSFIYISDENQYLGDQVITEMYKLHPDIELIFGCPDNGFGPTKESLIERWGKAWKIANPNAISDQAPIFIAQGNHDAEPDMNGTVLNGTVGTDWLVETYGPTLEGKVPGMSNFREGPAATYPNGFQDRFLTYSFDYKNCHFLVLNVYDNDLANGRNRFDDDYIPDGSLSDEMLAWIETGLKETSAEFKFLFYHEGAFPEPYSRHNGDSMDKYPVQRDKFWNILAKYDATATFVGHDHTASHVWARDTLGDEGAVLELEPGYVDTSQKCFIVEVDTGIATFKKYNRPRGTTDFVPFMDNIIVDKRAGAPNYPVKLEQHNGRAEGGYLIIDKDIHKLKVGEYHSGSKALYYEARDNDMDDVITFTTSGLPEFCTVIDLSDQFRRILIEVRELTEDDIGEYSFDVIASDGKTTSMIRQTIVVLPKEIPILY
jgi:hypothetical protein